MSDSIVTELNFYPIKSFRGLRANELRLGKYGVEWDRQWMLVDEENKFLTQRQYPQLAKIGLMFDEVSIELTLQAMAVSISASRSGRAMFST